METVGTITKRIDAITCIPEKYRTESPPCPRSVKIELTARCNFNCAFCATGERLRDKRDMDIGFYKKLLKDLRKSGVEEVGMFYLGESFLLPWLPQAIKEAKNEGFKYVFCTTNGSLATPEMVDRCVRAGLDSLKFSLNWSDETQFTEIARVKPELFGKAVANIKAAKDFRDKAFKDTGKFCGLYASYIQYDGDQGKKMHGILDELMPFLDEIYALPLYSQADLTGKAESERGWSVRAGNPGRAGNMRDPIPCWALFTEARVTHDGHLSACCFDHTGQFHMGNLNEVPFMKAWGSEKFQELRRAHLAGSVTSTVCEKCVAYQ